MLLDQLRKDGWCRVLRAAVPLGALMVEGWSAAIGCLVIQELGLWLAARLTDAENRVWAQRLFLAAYGVRALVTLPLHYAGKLVTGNGALFQDDYTNDLVAEWLVRIGRGEGISVFPGHLHVLDGAYPYLLVPMYALLGHSPLVPKLLNGVLASLSAVLVFDIARRAFRRSAAMIAAIGATAMPTLVIWSTVTIKESLVLLLALVGLWCLQHLIDPNRRLNRADVLLILAGAIVVSLDLRFTSGLILLGLLLVAVVARQHGPQRLWRVGMLGLLAASLVTGTFFFGRYVTSGRPPLGALEDVVLQIRNRRAQEAAGARSQIRLETAAPAQDSRLPAAEATGDAAPFSLVHDVLNPLGSALLAPAPWDARNELELAASGEVLVWTGMLGASFLAWRARPAQPLFIVCLVLYGVAHWLVLAVSEGNLGNLVRHRMMLAPTLLVLGGAGLDWLATRVGTFGPIELRRRLNANARGEP